MRRRSAIASHPEAGVEMIGKPFTLDALAAKIRSVLEA